MLAGKGTQRTQERGEAIRRDRALRSEQERGGHSQGFLAAGVTEASADGRGKAALIATGSRNASVSLMAGRHHHSIPGESKRSRTSWRRPRGCQGDSVAKAYILYRARHEAIATPNGSCST
jgi:hypothetical protein